MGNETTPNKKNNSNNHIKKTSEEGKAMTFQSKERKKNPILFIESSGRNDLSPFTPSENPRRQQINNECGNNNNINNNNNNFINEEIIYNKNKKKINDININISTEEKNLKTEKKFCTQKFLCQDNNMIILQNFDNSFSQNVSQEEIERLIIGKLEEYIVNNSNKFVKGKNITREHAKAICLSVFNCVKQKNIGNKENKSDNQFIDINDNLILEQINVKVRVEKLTREVVRKIFFKDRKVNQLQLEIALQGLTKGQRNMKVIMIELIP